MAQPHGIVRPHGAWRSLVAHSAGGRKVAGSNPVAPTGSRPGRRVHRHLRRGPQPLPLLPPGRLLDPHRQVRRPGPPGSSTSTEAARSARPRRTWCRPRTVTTTSCSSARTSPPNDDSVICRPALRRRRKDDGQARPSTTQSHKSEYPYSPGTTGGGLVYTSGQVAWDDHGNLVGLGDPVAQTRQVLTNVASVLREGSATLDDVLKWQRVPRRYPVLPGDERRVLHVLSRRSARTHHRPSAARRARDAG